MDIPEPSSSRYYYRPSLANRLSALFLALAVCALIVLLLIRMGLLAPGGGHGGERLTAISLQPRAATPEHRKAAARTAQAHPRTQVEQPVPQPPHETAKPVPAVPWIKLSRQEFAASDISQLPKHSAEDGGATSQGSAAAYGPGEGPGGARLYNAEWYREPTHAELITYMPHRDVAGGWAMIACKTQERYHVDDCQELGESPPGSGLARALRLAAWQFLVRPPRLEGKPLIGAWVRIRFDFTRAKATEDDEAPNGG